MKYVLTKSAELQTTNWAGGTTTQLAIFPINAEFKKFNFDFRISIATVEIEESTFTFMPGVDRYLMILQGILDIDHIGKYKKQLSKFDQDSFNGEWQTTAKGKVTDFNLLTRGNITGAIKAVALNSNESFEVKTKELFRFAGVYVHSGRIKIELKNESLHLNTGDFILFEKTDDIFLSIVSIEKSELVITTISNKENGTNQQ